MMALESYERVNWQDADSTETPLNAANLNLMDRGIEAVTEELQDFEESGVYEAIDGVFDGNPNNAPAFIVDNNNANGEYIIYYIDSDGVRHNLFNLSISFCEKPAAEQSNINKLLIIDSNGDLQASPCLIANRTDQITGSQPQLYVVRGDILKALLAEKAEAAAFESLKARVEQLEANL